MVTRRGPALKRLRYYLSQMPPERPLPEKKLNTVARGALDQRGLREGLAATVEEVQQGLLAAHLRSLFRAAAAR